MSNELKDFIRRYDLSFAVSLRSAVTSNSPALRYAAGQGVVFSLLRAFNKPAAEVLHDTNRRKALAVGPVRIQVIAPNLGRASLRVGVWQAELAGLLAEALRSATDLKAEVAGLPALLVSWQLADAWSPESLLATETTASVGVRFVTPTFFGFGRHLSGTPRAHLLPDPGLVVSSWLRAWQLTGNQSLSWLPGTPERLGEAVALERVVSLRSVPVIERTARLNGFVGECRYRWEGCEAAGAQALAGLARFANVCGTGAKTGRGFGQTEMLALNHVPGETG